MVTEHATVSYGHTHTHTHKHAMHECGGNTYEHYLARGYVSTLSP